MGRESWNLTDLCLFLHNAPDDLRAEAATPDLASFVDRSKQNAIYDSGGCHPGKVHHQGTYYPGQHPAIIDQELWDKVQARFAANLLAPRRRPRSASKSLLAGLLYDPKGNRFTPSHTAKGARRYHAKIGRAMMHLAPSVVSSSNQISPPIRSITSLATERPSPVPLSDAVPRALLVKKRSKTR